MSLFGDDQSLESPAARSRQLLFDDEETTPATAPQSALFANDDARPSSPWDLPTPRKKDKKSLLKTLLPSSDAPPSYIDYYDAALALEQDGSNKLSFTGVKNILGDSGLNADTQTKVLYLVCPNGEETSEGLGRNEANVLFALIGLAQEGEETTFDAVDERRKSLPEPSLPSYKPSDPVKDSQSSSDHSGPTSARPVTPPSKRSGSEISSSRTGDPRKASVEFPEVDPWGSPALHKGHGHQDSSAQATEPTRGSDIPSRTTSNFTTGSGTSVEPIVSVSATGSPKRVAAGWGSYDGPEPVPFASRPDLAAVNDEFGGPSIESSDRRTNWGAANSSSGPEEFVTITTLPEKEGPFMFRHHNYQVISPRRGGKVVRRYSDFVWLLGCLHKRYPFRRLPLLPPKGVAVNGSHLSADTAFLEKRRRGLTRFTNALVRHPVLNQEQLVIMFLTVPTELSVWRKQATISVLEEFTGKTLPPSLEDSLPPQLPDLFDTVRSGVRRSAELYINLCILVERVAKRSEGVAADYRRLAQGLESLSENSENTYAVDRGDVAGLDGGIKATARHLTTSQTLLEDEARASDSGVLEDLKRQRDCFVSMRDLFDRRDRLAKDEIPKLEQRIQANEAKLAGLRSRETLGAVKAGDIEKVTDAIIKDKQAIVAQHARGVFIKECIRDELVYFQHSQYTVSRLLQDWSQERVKYAELQADCWRGLNQEVERMPLGED